MATQTLEFNCTTGLTLSCKLFAVGSDTVVATASASEKTNNKNRYTVAFTDVAAGAYQMTAFVGSTGGFANEVYDLTLSTATFYPRSELGDIKTKTDLITSSTVTSSNPVTTAGTIESTLIIGDDYLNANGRAFSWTVAAITGITAATATCSFGGVYKTSSWLVTGTLTDNGNSTWTLRFDLPKSVTSLLEPGYYDWSVEIASSGGTEVTPVKSGRDAKWVEKRT